MDIAKAFEILQSGEIVSFNSLKYAELTSAIMDDLFLEQLREILNKIGYSLVCENGYYFMTKCGTLTPSQQQYFIQKNRDLIVAVAFLRELYPRVSQGSSISFLESVSHYMSFKNKNETIKNRLKYFSFNKNTDDEKVMLELLFEHLEKNNIIEKESHNNTDKYKVLNAIFYYISIVESIEEESDDD